MSARESLKLLGTSRHSLPERPEAGILETFPNRNPEQAYWVTLETAEFSSLCPVTGQPDHATLRIRYQPGEACLETKSLKFYLAAFRNHAAFNEEIVNRILADLVAVCRPRAMSVRGEFAARGGIRLTAEASHPAKWAEAE